MHVFETDSPGVTAVSTCAVGAVDLAGESQAERQQALSCYGELIEWAAGQGSRVLVVVGSATCDTAGFDGPNHGTGDALHSLFDAMRELVLMAERHSADVAVENAAAGLLSSPAELREFVDQLNSGYLGVCLNVVTASQHGRPDDWLTALGRRIMALRVPTDRDNQSLLTAARHLREDVVTIIG